MNIQTVKRTLLRLKRTRPKGVQFHLSHLNQIVSNKLSATHTVLIQTKQLIEWTEKLIPSLPRDIDVVCAIPRSGFIPATLIALRMVKPLSTPEMLSKGLAWMPLVHYEKEQVQHVDAKKILLVDDSVGWGTTMVQTSKMLDNLGYNLVRCAVIVSPIGKRYVDYYFQIVKPERIMEWGLAYTNLGRVVCDVDGVLCDSECKPLFIPHYCLEAVVSNRLEGRRGETECWLGKYGVKYKQLILARDKKNIGSVKIYAILKLKPNLYIESDYETAKRVWQITSTPTLCFDTKTLFN